MVRSSSIRFRVLQPGALLALALGAVVGVDTEQQRLVARIARPPDRLPAFAPVAPEVHLEPQRRSRGLGDPLHRGRCKSRDPVGDPVAPCGTGYRQLAFVMEQPRTTYGGEDERCRNPLPEHGRAQVRVVDLARLDRQQLDRVERLPVATERVLALAPGFEIGGRTAGQPAASPCGRRPRC